MTTLTIEGSKFLIDGKPTYQNRVFEGHTIQGLLFNIRAVQAIFDDANPQTRQLWAYPDTKTWDKERNLLDFLSVLPVWKENGILCFTVSFQGGGALFTPEIYDNFDNNAFTPSGKLKPDFASRMQRVIERADELGMVVIVSIFYAAHLKKLENEQAILRAAENSLEFLRDLGKKNILIEIANEIEVCFKRTAISLFKLDSAPWLINSLRKKYPEFIYSLSQVGANTEKMHGLPSEDLVKEVDYVLLHGNRSLPPQLESAINYVKNIEAYQKFPKPILINEDSIGIPNLDIAWRNGVSWGYFDQGFGGPGAWAGDVYQDYRSQPREDRFEELSGFQTPPINWSINTEPKRAFFERINEVTGYKRHAF